LFVHASIADRFVSELTARVEKLQAGNGLDDGVTVGPLIDDDAMAKMASQVDDAKARGAKVTTGGSRLTGGAYDHGTFWAPTVLTDVTPDMVIYSEETFGPIAPVTVFEDDYEAIEMANDTKYGLASYLYTRDLSRAIKVSEALNFAIIGVNDINPTSAAAPFGGLKESGVGREGAKIGLAEYLDSKVVGIAL
jgi:succinate-semialdehyde dehydrogenase/glutarate-semialdehyde dehydrogenase